MIHKERLERETLVVKIGGESCSTSNEVYGSAWCGGGIFWSSSSRCEVKALL